MRPLPKSHIEEESLKAKLGCSGPETDIGKSPLSEAVSL